MRDLSVLLGMLKSPPSLREVEYNGMGNCVIRRKEMVNSDDYDLGKMMIENCPECKKIIIPKLLKELNMENKSIHTDAGRSQ